VLHELRRTALLIVAALMAGMIWLYPEPEIEESHKHSMQFWWTKNTSPFRINFADSLLIESLPLSERARKSLQYRQLHKWYFQSKEDLIELPGVDTAWIQMGSFDFSIPERKLQPEPIHSPIEKQQVRQEVRAVDINSADSLGLIEIPGIGPWGAKAILDERRKWGHIASLNQLKDQFPFDHIWDTSFNHYLNFTPNEPRWSLNESPMDSLLNIPGFRYTHVKRIAFYRETFGKLTWEELANWNYWDTSEIVFLKLYISE